MLDWKTKKCFREDIPLSSDNLFTYTVAQGDGEMPIDLRISDIAGKAIHTRAAIDHGLFTFRSPDTIPGVKERGNWALHDDAKDEDDDSYWRAVPDGAGDNRVSYVFCFEHAYTLGLPRLGRRGQPFRRKIIFDIRSGADSKTMEYYDKLAKEKHLSTTEELFRVVEDRVSDIVRLIDEMRQRELRLDHITGKTNRMVGMYCTLACLTIAIGAGISSYATFKHLSRQKVA